MMSTILAAEGGYQEFTLGGKEWFWLIFSVGTALLAIAVGFSLMRGVLAADQGTPKMKEIAAAIQEGAIAYLKSSVPHDRLHPDPAGGHRLRDVDRDQQAAHRRAAAKR